MNEEKLRSASEVGLMVEDTVLSSLFLVATAMCTGLSAEH